MADPDKLRELASATEESLDAEPVRPATDDEIAQKKAKAEQTHNFRKTLFETVRWSLVATLAASAVMMVLYLMSQWGKVSPAVMVSFHTAVVVNTVGLAYIVANYLFPRGGGD